MDQPSIRPRSSYILMGFAALAVVCAVMIVWWPVAASIRSFERDMQRDHVTRGGQAFQVAVSRTIEREWASLLAVASTVNVDRIDGLRKLVDTVPRAGNRIAWAGYADQNGVIIAGSDRQREGASVADRRWFIEGMTDSSVGSVGGVYTPASNDPRTGDGTLVNMSVPILDDEGQARGVLVYNLRIEWLADFAQDVSEQLDIEIFVLGRDGSVVFERLAPGQSSLSEGVRSLAMSLLTQTEIAGSESGESHVSAVFPDLISGSMPNFGWRLLVRLQSATVGLHLDNLNYALWMACALLAGSLLVLAAVFAKLFLAPIQVLVKAAKEIASGADIYPPEIGLCRETTELSHSLVLIQGRLSQALPATAANSEPRVRRIA